MAVIGSTVETKFTTKGAKNTTEALDNVSRGHKKVKKASDSSSRSQQNVGKASANVTRQFGAQAHGMGGLVAAYAGAAATIFALQQGFAALNKSAQLLQILQGTKTLAAAIGESAKSILRDFKSITNGQLSLIDSASNVNTALSAGFSGKQIEGLASIALKASRALGRDLGDAVNRLTLGAAKLEPELLDELGIFTRIKPATQAYAVATGKLVTQLTSFERRQAFVNALLAEGNRKYKNINTTTETAAQVLEQLQASFIDLSLSAGGFLTQVLVPLAKFFTGNLLAKITLFGIAFKVVFGIALSTIAEQLTKVGVGVSNFSQGFINSIDKVAKKASNIGPIFKEAFSAKNFNLSNLNKQTRTDISPLVEKARTEDLSLSDSIKLNDVIEKTKKSLLKEKLALTRELEAKIKNKQGTKGLSDEINRLEKRYKQLDTAINKTSAKLKAQRGPVIIIARTFNKLGSAFNFVAKGVSGLFRALNVITIALAFLGTITAALAEMFDQVQLLNNALEFLFFKFKKITGIGKKDTIKIGMEGLVVATINANKELAKQKSLLVTIGKFSKEVKFGDVVKRAIKAAQSAIGPNGTKEGVRSSILRVFGANDISELTTETKAIFEKVVQATISALDKQKLAPLVASVATILGQSTGIVATQILDLQKNKDISSFSPETVSIAVLLNSLQKDLVEGLTNQLDAEKRVVAIKKLQKGLSENQIKDLAQISKFTVEQATNDSARLTALVGQRKQLALQFSSSISKGKKVTFNDSGAIAVTNLEQNKNTIQILGKVLKLNSEALSLRRKGVELTALQNEQAATAFQAEQAINGAISTAITNSIKLNKGAANKLITLKKQLEVLQSQNKIRSLQAEKSKNEADLSRENKLLTFAKSRLDIKRKTDDLAVKNSRIVQDKSLKNDLSNPLINNKVKSQIKIDIAEKQLDRLSSDLAKTVSHIETNTNINKEIINNKIDAEKRNILIETKIIQEQQKIEKSKITAQIKLNNLEVTNFRIKADLIKQEAKNFKGHITGLARVFATQTAAQKVSEGSLKTKDRAAFVTDQTSSATVSITQQINDSTTLLNNNLSNLENSTTAYNTALTNSLDKTDKVGNAQRDSNDRITAFNQELLLLNLTQAESIALAKASTEAERTRIKKAILDERNKNNVLLQLGKELSDGLKGKLQSSINDIITSVTNGTATIAMSFRQLMFDILSSISQSVTNKLIAEPIAQVVSSGASGFFSSLFGANKGGLVPGFNSGGVVQHFAAGGGVDTVPAMLTPGEFVMNRNATRSIGINNLKSMNNSGRLSNSPNNVQINVNNEGTPQDSSKQPQVNFDAEKMIIDVWLKDFQSGGSTRRALRSGKIR